MEWHSFSGGTPCFYIFHWNWFILIKYVELIGKLVRFDVSYFFVLLVQEVKMNQRLVMVVFVLEENHY